MSIRHTKIGAWLTLARVQSVPLTVVSLAIGYGTVTGDVVTSDIIPLLVVGAIAHLGGYILNDVADLEHDTEANRDEKPLVAGDISDKYPVFASVGLILTAIYISTQTFNFYAQNVFMISVVVGVVYNLWSKHIPVKEVVLGTWGFTIIMTGAACAGGGNIKSVIVGLMLFLLLMWLSVLDGVKEISNEKRTIPKLLGARVDSNIVFSPSKRFIMFSGANLAGITLLSLIMVAMTGNLFHIAGDIVIALPFIATGYSAVSRDIMGREHRAMIVMNTLMAVVVAVWSISPLLGIWQGLLLVSSTAVWGLGWQKIIFGDAMYFP